MAALLVQMTNERCQMVNREVDEGLVPCDAMDAHQDRRNRRFGTAIWLFWRHAGQGKNGGAVEVFGTKKMVEPLTAARGMSVVMQWTTVEAVTTRLGSQQALRDKQGPFGCAHEAQNLSWRLDVSIDTTHFKLASRRHGWNWSQNASDRKGLLSFGCSLEQLELLGMLESHIERLERLEKAARDLAALSNDRQDRGRSAWSKLQSVLEKCCWQLLTTSSAGDTTWHQPLEALACPNWPINPPAVTSGVVQQGLHGAPTTPRAF